jgi:eukaryotic-like serine/threonine-protein kinase
VKLTLDVIRERLRDKYQVARELGHGGMARVFLAEDLQSGERVALKILRPEVASALGSARFYREVDILRRMRHPNIVPILDAGTAGALLYLVMPFIAGETLRARLEKEGPLAASEVLAITRDIAAAIDHAHGHGIIHRDIKPANILLTEPGAMVCDFGLARAIDRATVEPISSSGLVLGTPAYMSPEQATGERELDTRSDIYALGCVVYEMLTGEQPFTGPSSQAILARQLTERPRPIRTVRPQVTAEVELAILTALRKDPQDRPASGSELVALMVAKA